jgi:heat shock protein HslJ
MKKIIFPVIIFFIVCICSCATKPGTDLGLTGSSSGSGGGADTDANANPKPDGDDRDRDGEWDEEAARKAAAGVYRGLVPYPNTDGVETIITIKKDGTYLFRSRVVGKPDDTFEMNGRYNLNREGIVVLDKTGEQSTSSIYTTGPDILTQLDSKGQAIPEDSAGRYILKRIPAEITETYWKLISLYGSPVVWTGSPTREPHIILRLGGFRVFGHSGTNSFSGTYVLKDGGGISFSKVISTMVASPNMHIERGLYKALGETNSFTIDEGIFTLGEKGKEPAAVFEAVYLR